MISTCSLPDFNPPLPTVDGAPDRHRRRPPGRLGIYLATGGEFQLAAVTLLARLPDLGQALQQAPPALKRQVFEAFCLQVVYDKPGRRIEISATISEAVAQALQNTKDLPKEISNVAHRDIAGARYVPPSDAQILHCYRLAA